MITEAEQVRFMDPRIPVRLWNKILVDENGCWLWTAYIDECGYGRCHFESKKSAGAHRVFYRQTRGPVPQGLELDHLCRTRHCVNPNHLEAITHAENVRRSEHPKRFKRVCKHGHDLVPGNLYFWKRRGGWVRACRACGLDRSLAQKAKRRAA